ncbi:MAG: hypothetical protein JW969_04805 [Spirochaetales bacterium]|nr:hypothetical protein [Spirochaetales bacterium]
MKNINKRHTFLWLTITLMVIFTAVPAMAADRGEWTEGSTYAAGDTVTYLGKSYKCLISHTAWMGANWNPVNAPSLWLYISNIDIPTPDPSCPYDLWNPAVVYVAGNRVSWNTHAWEAKWWTVGAEPGRTGEWGVWLDLGTCGRTPTPTPDTNFPPGSTVSVIPIPDSFDIRTVEGNRLHPKAELLNNMRVVICNTHFPPGSQGRANVQKIIDLFNDTPYLGVHMTLSPVDEIEEEVLFGSRPEYSKVLYIDIIEQHPKNDNIGDELVTYDSSTAFLAQYGDDPNDDKDESIWCWGRNDLYGTAPGFATDQAVLPLRKEFFSDYSAYPLIYSGNAPSAGVLFHEMGHYFHMEHPERRFGYQVLDNMCNRVGHVDGLTHDHARDFREPRITAYTRKIFEDVYHLNYADTKQEWVIHDILGKNVGASEWADTDYRYFTFPNPRSIGYEMTSGRLIDLNTGNPINIRTQFSDASRLTAGNGTVKLRVTIEDSNTLQSLTLVDYNVPIHMDDFYAQYDFDEFIDVEFSAGNVNPLVGSADLELVFKIDADNSFEEYHEYDNDLRTPVTLTLVQ